MNMILTSIAISILAAMIGAKVGLWMAERDDRRESQARLEKIQREFLASQAKLKIRCEDDGRLNEAVRELWAGARARQEAI